jgi:predicted DNA-binding transcriptional regulator AlpA
MANKLTRTQVATRYCVSIRTIIRWTDDPKWAALNFPKPVKLGLRNQLYDLDELEAWERERAEAQRTRAKAQGNVLSDLSNLEIEFPSGVAA